MADKKKGPIVIKVFETCPGEAKCVIVSTVCHHRLHQYRRGVKLFWVPRSNLVSSKVKFYSKILLVYFAEFVSYLGERWILCMGHGSYFCTPVVMCKITFQVLRLCTFVFNVQVFRKKKSQLYLWLGAYLGFGWNNAGPASQTVAWHFISIGPMYRVIAGLGLRLLWVIASWGLKGFKTVLFHKISMM